MEGILNEVSVLRQVNQDVNFLINSKILLK